MKFIQWILLLSDQICLLIFIISVFTCFILIGNVLSLRTCFLNDKIENENIMQKFSYCLVNELALMCKCKNLIEIHIIVDSLAFDMFYQVYLMY